MFHRHKFEDVSFDYHPPDPTVYEVRGGSLIDKVLSGWTIIHQRCECGNIRTKEVIGKYKGEV
jgi:hypothetical protein